MTEDDMEACGGVHNFEGQLLACLQNAVEFLPDQNNVAEARRRRMVNAITESVMRRLKRR